MRQLHIEHPFKFLQPNVKKDANIYTYICVCVCFLEDVLLFCGGYFSP